jgi:hypothetical protein
MATAELEEDEDGEAPGTATFPPSMTWTCPAATWVLAAALTPNSLAIWPALAAEPVP